MLKNWTSHQDYQKNLISALSDLYPTHKFEIISILPQITKLYVFNLDDLKEIIAQQYSDKGRPAEFQPEIFRSFVFMLSNGCFSITKWIRILKLNPLYCSVIGFDFDNIPSLGAHYKLIQRLWNAPYEYDKPKILPFKTKPKNKLKKNEKKPEKSKNVVRKLFKKIIKGHSFNNRPEIIYQNIFSVLSVETSKKLGLLGNHTKLTISGDGTNIETGANSYGIKTCNCRKNGIFNCKCPRRFSDPNATWGWDSYHGRWFYGYTNFMMTVNNTKLKLDLPIYFRIAEAKRHDSVLGIVALQELKQLLPQFKFKHFLGDSAFDNMPTYELLNRWKLSPIIALNNRAKGNFSFYQPILNDNGIPVCQGGHEMIYDGPDYTRQRTKWRCPIATNKIKHCDNKINCSQSPYGRVHHTSFKDNYRLFTPVPRGTKQWKNLMKLRTASERVNSRLLNDYSIESTKVRGKKHWTWWTLIGNINIHLDAQVKHANFDFSIDIISMIETSIAA